MKGVRVVVTYNCNIMCSHCKYGCSPLKKGIMSPNEFEERVVDEYNRGFEDYIMIEGGEPFLHSGTVFKYMKKILHLNTKKYIVTNGFWGGLEPYTDILQDFKRNGLSGIVIEYDYFHSLFINMNTIKEAIIRARIADLDVKLKAVFVTGNIKDKSDIKTFEYIKKLKNEFNGIEIVFDEAHGRDREEYILPSRRNIIEKERVVLYKSK
ncbi:radical SAM protein [Fonticella tunisiensis]|uniref:4Fe-4S single cluster protein n=1 Tax=Fonticella tunisiensis TaxID=1096341 RepID=A0A4R7KP32_9CLOT|nr:radical SAM protein [Fonticella tunisiensis]TDT58452.1 4Fe-4S single cluster protein [Fonticella tunisiensis]